MILDENLFEAINEEEVPAVETEVVTDSEIEPEGPAQGIETGIANLIHDLIIDVNEAIQNYNNAATNMEDYPELQKIMQNIAGDEFTHIGELEKALELISPNAANIEEGEVESEEVLADEEIPTDESLNEDTIKQNGKWVNKGKEGTHGTFKTKKAADAQRKAMFSQGFHEDLEDEIDDSKFYKAVIIWDEDEVEDDSYWSEEYFIAPSEEVVEDYINNNFVPYEIRSIEEIPEPTAKEKILIDEVGTVIK